MLGTIIYISSVIKPRHFCSHLINKPQLNNYNNYVYTTIASYTQFYNDVYPNSKVIKNKQNEQLEYLDKETGYIIPLEYFIIEKYNYLINQN